jgi:hypothetical protein
LGCAAGCYNPSDLNTRMQAIVLFADLLGFAALTELHEVSEDDFEVHDRPETDDFLTANLEGSCALVQTYIRFQVAVQNAVSLMHTAGDHATSVTFSDSAFVATETFETAKTLAISLMSKLLPHGIMLRVGIARGSFVPIRFRADVSLGSGEHSAQFLGTGVVRAYATAEKSCLKGARILVHPSATSAFDSQPGRFFQPIPIGADEQTNPVGVTHEVSYLGRHDRDLYRGVQRAHRAAPTTASDHYEATYRAMNRMRALLNRPPIEFRRC